VSPVGEHGPLGYTKSADKRQLVSQTTSVSVHFDRRRRPDRLLGCGDFLSCCLISPLSRLMSPATHLLQAVAQHRSHQSTAAMPAMSSLGCRRLRATAGMKVDRVPGLLQLGQRHPQQGANRPE
jgi:hypothetical protein